MGVIVGMKMILLFFNLFLISGLHAQRSFFFNNDTTKIFYECKINAPFNSEFVNVLNKTIFHDSVSFYSFMDTLIDKNEMPSIDFRTHQVGFKVYCSFCKKACFHDFYEGSECHRNACDYQFRIYAQRKNRREEILFKSIFLPKGMYLRDSVIGQKEKWADLNKDSLITVAIDFSKEILLFRAEGGDCHARISHEFYLDHINKKLVWKLYNQYGGCRAGLFAEFLMLVPKPPEGYSISFQRILLN